MLAYRKMEREDIPAVIELRLGQMREESGRDTAGLAESLASYYDRHLPDGSFVSWLAVDGERIVATSGMSFVEKPPYSGNVSGRIGLLSSMYTLEGYRRRGIARTLLGRVVDEAAKAGCGAVQITASDMGVLLYRDFGFEKNGNFMQYKL